MNRILTLAQTVWIEMLRRKDFYVLLILLLALMFSLMTANVFGLGETTRYLMDLGLLMAWIFSLILAVNLVGRQLPKEEERGTVFPLLAKPVSRGELLLGKWLGVWVAVSLANAVFYAVLTALVLWRGGGVPWVTLIQGWILHCVALGVAGAVTLALSTRMTYGAAATTGFVVVGASYALVPRIPHLLEHETGFRAIVLEVLYYLLPHFELFDLRQRIVHEWGRISWGLTAGVALYGAILIAFFLLLAWLGYRNKHFRRGEAL